VRLRFVDAPSRVNLTMAPDCVLAIRHAALGAPAAPHAGRVPQGFGRVDGGRVWSWPGRIRCLATASVREWTWSFS
jgi:hypothetical protein